MKKTKQLLTVGVIAVQLNEPLHRIEYLIRSRGIQPASRAGNSRVFSEESVQKITNEIKQIDASRQPKNCEV